MTSDDINYWRARCAETEEVLEHCAHALSLIPVNQIALEYTWIPSEHALKIIDRAKESIHHYAGIHWVENDS